MWIMLKSKLPVQFSPPKMSFHWSEPWENIEFTMQQFYKWMADRHPDELNNYKARKTSKQVENLRAKYPERYAELFEEYKKEPYLICATWGKKEHNWSGAKCIVFQGQQIRVFPDEFNDSPSLKMYIEDDAVILHPSDITVSEGEPFTDLQKVLYEHALVDGCDKFQATLTAYGSAYDDISVPPVGWYELKSELAQVFCSEEEMEWEKKAV